MAILPSSFTTSLSYVKIKKNIRSVQLADLSLLYSNHCFKLTLFLVKGNKEEDLYGCDHYSYYNNCFLDYIFFCEIKNKVAIFSSYDHCGQREIHHYFIRNVIVYGNKSFPNNTHRSEISLIL